MKNTMSKAVREYAKRFPDRVASALFQECEIEATEVKRRTPVDKGNLRGSVHVEPPERDWRTISCRIVAGGVSAPYAIYVHENLEAFHPVGEAKFLESVILESRPFMAERVAQRLKDNENG